MFSVYGVQAARALLVVLCLGQALVTARFLVFMHGSHDVPGDYGVPWRARQAHDR